ncbi:aspartyl/asparaginyl beta-hydroxylase domain-containing protein [Stagnimonas aquatica]|uniref:aspartyl/asparaginyl beta-hydroxylase domain-containing protein n=1 Tax=Stagnimonas aquatica TaxID=2689987 RepID=UPI001F3F1569|nr:aspartyl/asparaginyl beta-hydroxylase domain-containing protein [Stagnimonas aquatica]
MELSRTIQQTLSVLHQQASEAMAAADAETARDRLKQALNLHSSDPGLWLHLAAASRACCDYSGAMVAVDQALRLDPRFFLALLMRATLLERDGKSKEAARAYGVALTQAPADSRLDSASLQAIRHGRLVYERYLRGMREHLNQIVPLITETNSGVVGRRLANFVDSTLGLKPRFRQEPTDYFYPGLPATEFWERGEFPWLEELEAATPRIQQELAQIMAVEQGFTPYVDYPDGIPLDQWAALNRSLSWSAFHFFHHGRRYEENCLRCPATMAALAKLPQPQAAGRMPAAMFSVLKPQTRIPPHTGVANVRLVMHLPLVVPSGCGFRVGNEIREWRVGQAWIFDDTIEHEAWNNSNEVRVVLICDVWNPRLSTIERENISAVLAAMDSYNELTPSEGL